MKIDSKLKGKEVITGDGDKIGEVSDANWNPKTNRIESFIVSKGSILGGSKTREINYKLVKTIGEKVLLYPKSEIKEIDEPPSLEEIKRRLREV